MDGNGRWAKARSLPRVAGHREGAKTVNTIVTECRKIGLRVLTLFAFSSQNWVRPSLEVQALMALLARYVESERSTIMDNDIRLTAIGEIDSLPDGPRRSLMKLIDDSSSNESMTLCLALSYGGREEIVNAAKKLCTRVSRDELSPDEIDNDTFSSCLWSSELGDLDLIIRTSGELRISNFLLWSAAYSEFFFSQKMWPDFSTDDLYDALRSFSSRKRRFGDIGK